VLDPLATPLGVSGQIALKLTDTPLSNLGGVSGQFRLKLTDTPPGVSGQFSPKLTDPPRGGVSTSTDTPGAVSYTPPKGGVYTALPLTGSEYTPPSGGDKPPESDISNSKLTPSLGYSAEGDNTLARKSAEADSTLAEKRRLADVVDRQCPVCAWRGSKANPCPIKAEALGRPGFVPLGPQAMGRLIDDAGCRHFAFDAKRANGGGKRR
jgi:hypothetical protein